MAVAGVVDNLLSSNLERICREVDSAFDALLPVPDDARARLVEAMRYAAIGGGKRMRPLLLCGDCRSVRRRSRDAALRAGAAIEAIHVYSLIHDDLPCMDDDDLRHGKPTAAQGLRRGDRGAGGRCAACAGVRDSGRSGA